MAETAETMKAVLSRNSYLLDPHSAIGVRVAQGMTAASPMVVLATAHPAKFPDAVKSATGVTPALPDWLSDLMTRPENYKVLPSYLKMIEDYISARSRAAAERV